MRAPTALVLQWAERIRSQGSALCGRLHGQDGCGFRCFGGQGPQRAGGRRLSLPILPARFPWWSQRSNIPTSTAAQAALPCWRLRQAFPKAIWVTVRPIPGARPIRWVTPVASWARSRAATSRIRTRTTSRISLARLRRAATLAALPRAMWQACLPTTLPFSRA